MLLTRRHLLLSSVRQPAARCLSVLSDREARKAVRFFQFERPHENIFKTCNLDAYGRTPPIFAFGGLTMSQALAAAELTMSTDYKPHSIHSFFLRNVDISTPVEYHVRLLRVGGISFQARCVDAIQNDKIVFSLQASFHKPEPDSMIHQIPIPTDVTPAALCTPLPEATALLLEKMEKEEIQESENSRRYLEWYNESPWTKWFFDYRCTDTPALFGFGSGSPRTFFVWVKAKGSLPEDERLHRWLALFASDALPATVIVGPHTKNVFPSMHVTLDHTMHFHSHVVPTEEWLLYEMEPTVARGSRGFVSGRLWRLDGKLLASFSQEILVRAKIPASH